MPIYVNNGQSPIDSGGGGIPQADESTLGGAEVATQGETDTGTDDTRMVTPLKLANYSGIPATADGESVGVNITPGSSIAVNIPANTLAADGDYLQFQVIGLNGGGDGSATIALGATTIATVTAIESGGAIYFRGLIVRTGATAQVCITEHSSGPRTGEWGAIRGTATEDLSTLLALTVTGTGGSPNFDALIIRKWAA